MNVPSVSRIAGAVYAAGVLVMCIRAGEPEHLWWWLVMLPFAVWIASPVLGGLYLRREVERAPLRFLFAILLAVIGAAGFAAQWHTMFIGPSDGQNAFIFLFVPFYQWAGVALALASVWLLGKAFGRAGRTQ